MWSRYSRTKLENSHSSGRLVPDSLEPTVGPRNEATEASVRIRSEWSRTDRSPDLGVAPELPALQEFPQTLWPQALPDLQLFRMHGAATARTALQRASRHHELY